MTITPKPKKRPSAFSRWLHDKRVQLGAAIDDLNVEFKAAPPTRPATNARHKRVYDEADIIRIPAAVEDIEASKVVGKVLQDAWRRGEAHVSLSTLRGSKISSEDNDRYQRDPRVVPGPDPRAPVVTILEAEVYKPERTPYVVRYTIEGLEYTAGPYLTEEIAREHAADIRAFEGVTACYIVPLTTQEPSE